MDGGWGQWGQWSSCSKTCDIGIKKREHKCDNPKPQYGGKPCNKSEAMDIHYCREEGCDGKKTAEQCQKLRAEFLNAVYFGRSLTCTLGLIKDLIDDGQPVSKQCT